MRDFIDDQQENTEDDSQVEITDLDRRMVGEQDGAVGDEAVDGVYLRLRAPGIKLGSIVHFPERIRLSGCPFCDS